MDQIGNTVIYIDPAGVTHEALVFGQNVLHPELLDLVYVDSKRPDNDNLIKVFSIEHADAKKETNPDLPAYPLNAWKEYYQEHQVIPPDHPNFDHPFKAPDLGLNGQPIPVERPITAAFEATHKEMQALSKEDSDELAALSGSGGMAAHTDSPNVGIPTKPNTTMPAEPVTSTEGLQSAIEGITGVQVTPEQVEALVTDAADVVDASTKPADADASNENSAQRAADPTDPPNCQPGQLC